MSISKALSAKAAGFCKLFYCAQAAKAVQAAAVLGLALLALSCQTFAPFRPWRALPKGEDFLLQASFYQGAAAMKARIFITKKPSLSLRADILAPFAGIAAQFYLFQGAEGFALLPLQKKYQKIKPPQAGLLALFPAHFPSLIALLAGEFKTSSLCSAHKSHIVCKLEGIEAHITQKGKRKLSAVLKSSGQKDIKIKVRKISRVRLKPEVFVPNLQGFEESAQWLSPLPASEG